ncbi:uncharacterized protein LOC127851734 [Dreissena polymorpha]|uniref:Uncharacterized protein n=1 Tax=Dreissena polymorpha TaxID=45954 RepID=A0A9D4CY59_DREPO|nr:uncharacterized protein LOC127851734 [Dreissena polymorpha]KAH3735165.1 hypothetical protein DPMN_041626 [Dreissena polymorpha]
MATGHKLVKEITDQFLHCKICYEPYKEPKTLTCLHTFCADCIQKHVDSDTNRSSRFLLYTRYITCPLCRAKTEIPSGGVRRLQDNFLLSSLTDVLDRKRVGKFPPCEICPGERQRGNNYASHKCLDCAKLLCKTCVSLHATTKVTQHHSLIDIEGEKDIECKTHPEEIVRYYCEPCDECVCVVCTFQEHRDHEICSFSDGFSKYREGLDNLLTRCKERLTDVQSRVTTINNVETALKETRENIRDLAISYIAQVRQTERQLMQKMEQEYGSKIESFLQNKESLQENLEGLQTSCNLAEIIMNDRGVEMLLLKRELQNKLSALLEAPLPDVPEDIAQSIKFVPGIVKLGHISMNSETDDVDGNNDVTIGGKHALQDENEQPRKRRCLLRDAQTNTTPRNSQIVPDIKFDFSKLNGELSSKSDVSVNTICGGDGSGVCVKCSAELKKDFGSTHSLPVVDGTAPVIQDIIITNDGKERRRRRSFIKSRRVQTDVSLSNESIDELFSPTRMSSQESLNGSFRKLSQNSLTAVAECVITVSTGSDPIGFPPEEKPVPKPLLAIPRTYTRNKGVNTTEEIRVVRDSRSVRTNTNEVDYRESATMTTPNIRTIDSQTPDKILVHQAIATDYTGQRNKRTSTPIIIQVDSSTFMSPLSQENKFTWTESVQTTERSICTDNSETMESTTETVPPSLCDQSFNIKPEVQTVQTNTDPVQFADQSDPVSAASSKKTKERKSKTKEKESKEKSGEKKTKEKKEKRAKKKYKDSCIETEPVIRNVKETWTTHVQTKESWSTTVSLQLVNTGTTPDRPATREAGIATNPVVKVEQGTYTEVINLQDNSSETAVIICDNETLTERIGLQDAQTSIDLYTQTSETLTDNCYLTDTGCMTDSEWFWDLERDVNVVKCDVCQETRAFVETSTSPIECKEFQIAMQNKSFMSTHTQTVKRKFYDKSVVTSFDFDDVPDGMKGILCTDVSTSTENLPYIGLLSDMDCDELILVPEIAFDVISSEAEYRKAYAFSFPNSMCDSSTQTIVSSAIAGSDLDPATLESFLKAAVSHTVTIGVNTEQKLTFEKETWTPSLHQLTQGTNTSSNTDKSDKSTSTESYVRAIKESFVVQSPRIERSAVEKIVKNDMSTETDNSLLDDKMIACINKLKIVSERLNSPTTKMFAESMPWGRLDDASDESLLKELDRVPEAVRKKTVMNLVAKSKEMTKSNAPKTEPLRRKVQPITSLKPKQSQERAVEPAKQKDGNLAIQRQDSIESVSSTTSSKTGSQTPLNEKKPSPSNGRTKQLRSNSTPGRIATVPNQTAGRKSSPRAAPKTTPKPDQSKEPPAGTSPPPGPDFYSTVPKTRHPKHGLASITENRHSASGSTLLDKSASSSTDKSLDFSSLKINAPQRAPSASPTPPRHEMQQNGRLSRQASAANPRIEVLASSDGESETRARTGSTSSDQTDEPLQEKKGFIKKLFGSKKKKSTDKRNASPSKSPKPGRKAIASTPQPSVPEEPTEKVKEKPKPFVYMRSRIFSIEEKDNEKYHKPIVNKYCINKDEEEKPPVFDFAATFTKKK